MQMYVYLIHFKYKLHHAGHYIGFSRCLNFRIASHREGTGAKLIGAITRLGIPWIVIRTWRVDGQGFERYLKNQKHAARFCPLCNPKITEFQNEYVGGDDFGSEFLDEILELNERTAINTYALPTQYSEKPYTFEASSFTAACVVATLLGGGFYSLWRNGRQVMPAFMFGGAEKWYQRTFGKSFQDVVQEVSPDEIAQIYLTLLVGKPEERQRYLQELSIIHHSKPALVSTTSQWRPQIKPTPYGSCMVPDGGDVVQLLDGRELPVQEILGEIGINLWIVDLGEIPSYAITPGGDGRWEEVETTVA